MKDIHDLGLLIDSNIPIIVVESHEEERVLDTVTRLAIKKNLPCYSWTVTDGLKKRNLRLDVGRDPVDKEPDEVLNKIKKSSGPAIYILNDFHPYIEDRPKTVRLIKDIALLYRYTKQTVIFLSHRFNIPPEVKRFTAHFEMSLPTEEQLIKMIREESNRWSQQHMGAKVQSDRLTLNKFVKNLRGVTFSDARHLIRGAIVDDGAITSSDLPELNKAKFKLMDLEGVLTYEYDTASFRDVGGLSNLKKWLKTRQSAFKAQNGKIDQPKGILLLGVQGSGKSLAAKAVASQWHLPLLRLDFGSLYNKYFGETEKNLRESLKLAEVMAPCVLWMDEIEKGIGSDNNDQGVSQRLLSTLLTWMAEKTKLVFIAATANNIHSLPPELIRKGRLDEIFFVDLPSPEVRETIFAIHLKKRDLDPALFDLRQLAEATDGFSGAEIEQSIVAALYGTVDKNNSVGMNHILTAVSNTVPLSVVMAEDIAQLRLWAGERTVPAH